MSNIIGIDVGSTKVLIGKISGEGAVIESKRYHMDRSSRENAVNTVFSVLDDFLAGLDDGFKTAFIGIGAVGHIDTANGIWVHSMNIPIDKPVPITSMVQERFGIPAAIDNDVHCAALAELYLGAGKRTQNFIYLNIGTGIAAGMVCGGRLIRGSDNYAGELGHMKVELEGEPCVCGNSGCLEPIASGGGMIKQVVKRLGQYPDSVLNDIYKEGILTSRAIFKAADSGDRLAVIVSERAVRGLGTALVNMIILLNPEEVVLGGGVVSDNWLLERLEQHVRKNALPSAVKSLKGLALSELKPDYVGVLGAGCLEKEYRRCVYEDNC